MYKCMSMKVSKGAKIRNRYEVKIKHHPVRGTVTLSCIQVSGALVPQLWVQYFHCQWAPFLILSSPNCKNLMKIL